MISPTATFNTESDWLAARQHSIGASEIAAVLGVSEYQTPVDIWQLKTGRAKPFGGNQATKMGLMLEPVIKQLYEEETGQQITQSQVFIRHANKPLSSTLDGVTATGRIVEFKTAGPNAKGWSDDEPDGIPDAYYCQVQQQLLVSGNDGPADLALLKCGVDFRIFNVTRSDSVQDKILEYADRFWWCVKHDTPPDWGRQTAETLAVRNPRCEGEITLAPSVSTLVAMYEECKKREKDAESESERLRVEILSVLGTNAVGILPDGRRVKRYLSDVAERTYTVTAKAYTRHYFSILKGR